jgi:proteasome lid subunit RPN8/RPN11
MTARPTASPYRLVGAQLSQLARRARGEARSTQREVAGALVGRDGLIQLVPLRNVSRRRGSFALRKSDIQATARAARCLLGDVVGTFHSHIASDATPGPRDIREAGDGSLMLIYDTIGQEWRLWRIRGGRAYPIRFAAV